MLLYQIALSLIPGIGSLTAKKLIAYCGNAEQVFREKKSTLIRIPRIGRTLIENINNRKAIKQAEQELTFIEENNIGVCYYLDKTYPERLKHCEDSPIVLYYKGNADLNAGRVLSVVGTRNATFYGKEVCETIIGDLTNDDVLIVSGLAYGIDSIAHQSAINLSMPNIAVLAHGLDRVYPFLHKKMADKIVNNGGLITEFVSGSNPDRENFPKRNRIIAGLSDAVLVIESGVKGGALITADIANSYSREVFAVPGRVGDLASRGCNELIKSNKAALVRNADDIRYYMNWDEKQHGRQQKLFADLDEKQQIIYDFLVEYKEADIDQICRNTKLKIPLVTSELLRLEFMDIVRSFPGKVYRLVQ